jgi:hypothetical protein
VERPVIDWAELAEHAGIVSRKTASGSHEANQGTDEARRALEWLIGENNIRSGVELWLARRPGEQAAAATAWSVLMSIRSKTATELAYGAYRSARTEGRSGDAALAVILICGICHPVALDWVGEFVDYEPTANAGLGLVDQALFRGVIYADDDRLENWLYPTNSSSDPYVREAVRHIRESIAKWPMESQSEQPSGTPLDAPLGPGP